MVPVLAVLALALLAGPALMVGAALFLIGCGIVAAGGRNAPPIPPARVH